MGRDECPVVRVVDSDQGQEGPWKDERPGSRRGRRLITRDVLYSALLQIKRVYVAINFHEPEKQTFLKIKKF